MTEALVGEFADAPLYADISALTAVGRTGWLRRLAAEKALHRKLVWGSDFPIPVFMPALWGVLDRAARRRIAALPSWVEQSAEVCREVGFSDCVFTQAAEILGLR